MSIVNQIANFGKDAGDGLTAGLNERRRRKEADRNYNSIQQRYDLQDKRYNNELARMEQQQSQAAQQRERDLVTNGYKSVLGSPKEYQPAAYAGFLEQLKRNGVSDVEMLPPPEQFNEQTMYQLAGKFGVTPEKTELGSAYGKVDPKDFTPESIAQFQATGDYSQLRLNPQGSRGPTGTPKAFAPEQYTDSSGNTKWGMPTFDPNTGRSSMQELTGMTPIEQEKGLSATTQKILDESQAQYFDSDRKAREYEVLAKDIEMMSGKFGGGLESKWTETYKEMTGDQDAVTDLRRRFYGVRASQAVSNLPPGVASDKDIALALSGFPDEKANAQQVASFMQGMAKLERLKAEFHSFKSERISTKGDTRNLISDWKKHAEQTGIYGSEDNAEPPSAAGGSDGQSDSIAQPTTQAEFNALPSGAMFVDPDDGQTYRKP